jgi:multicomponent Na+:H+ antiporter subunit A
LALWHGVSGPLVLSIAALIGGMLLFAARVSVLRRIPDMRTISRWGPDSWYERLLRLLQWVAQRQTAVLQNGYLRRYVLTVLTTTAAMIGLMLFYTEGALVVPPSIGVRFHEAVAAAVILAAAWTTIRSTNRYRAIASLGVIGMSISWIYALFGGPDLAMTQVVVEALTVLLFVVAFRGLPNFRTVSSTATRVRDALVALAFGGVIATLLLLATSISGPSAISDYYADRSYREAHGRNVVNVILVDFRALDTMGEVTVLATAAMGVYVLIRLVVGRSSQL